jgi:hypothetical protein
MRGLAGRVATAQSGFIIMDEVTYHIIGHGGLAVKFMDVIQNEVVKEEGV